MHNLGIAYLSRHLCSISVTLFFSSYFQLWFLFGLASFTQPLCSFPPYGFMWQLRTNNSGMWVCYITSLQGGSAVSQSLAFVMVNKLADAAVCDCHSNEIAPLSKNLAQSNRSTRRRMVIVCFHKCLLYCSCLALNDASSTANVNK